MTTPPDSPQRREVHDELAFHVDMRTRDLMASGVDPVEARRRADAEFRPVVASSAIEAACVDLARRRDRRLGWANLTSGLAQDVRHAARRTWRRRRGTAVAVMTMALGIGAATAIYSVVDSVLLSPLPFPEPDRLVSVSLTDEQWHNDPVLSSMWDRIPIGRVEYDPLLTEAPSLGAVGLYNESSALIAAGADGQVERVTTVRATASLLRALQVQPCRGRLFQTGEDVLNGPAIALLSWETWHARFAAAEDVIGSTVVLDETPFQIVGVLPKGVRLNRGAPAPAIWVPALQQTSDLPGQRNRSYRAIGRLAAGASVADAQRETAAVFRATSGPKAELSARVEPWQQDQTRNVRASLAMLVGAVALLLAIASLNVAMIAIADAVTRQQEVASRVALGASITRLFRQWITESLVVASVAAPIGWGLAWLGVEALLDLGPSGVPGLADTALNGRALAFASILLASVGVVMGLAPAVLLSRRATRPVGSGSRHTTRGVARAQRALIATEIALSFVLLVGCGLLGHSLSRLREVEVGFRPDGLTTLRLSATRGFWRDGERVERYFDGAASRIAGLPGVIGVTTASSAPFAGGNSSSSIQVEGDEAGRSTMQVHVGPGYFDVMGTPLLAGRTFGPADAAGAEPVVIVSASAARRDFGDASPIGRRVRWQGKWRTIVGVVGDVRFSRLSGPVQPAIYAPSAQTPGSQVFLIRLGAASDASMAAIRQRVQSIDRTVVVQALERMPDLVAASYAEDRYRVTLVAAFGLMACVMAAVGVFAVAARTVAARQRETGIRLALGASPARVTRAITQELGLAITAGLVVGAATSVPIGRWLAPQLFEITALDTVAYAGAGAVLVGAVVVALVGPVRRAMHVDPAMVLRGE